MADVPSRGLFWEALPQPHPLTRGRNYLLLIGIDQYRHLAPLHNAVKDVQDFYDTLCARYHFQPEEATLLLNGAATRANILDAFDRLLDVVKPEDNLIIYYAGHGKLDKRQRGYWIPVDARPERASELIYNTIIREYVADIPSRHTLLIVDSCFSGAMTRGAASDAEAFANRVEGLPSRWLLTSGRNELVADGRQGHNSPFAHSLLTYLKANQQPKLPVSALVQHVKLSTPRTARQTPYGSYLPGAGDQHGEMIFHLSLADAESQAWAEAREAHTPAAYYRYLAAYPQGRHLAEAEQALAELRQPSRNAQALAWERTREADTHQAYQAFVDTYPEAEQADQARMRMAEIEDEAFQQACQRDTEQAYRAFYRTYPQSTYHATAVAKLNEKKEARLWEEAQQVGTEEAYRQLLTQYPHGLHASHAQQRLDELARMRQHLPEMVLVKGATFLMGDPRFDNSQPVHEVSLDDYWVGKYPVTVAQYRFYCEQSGAGMPREPRKISRWINQTGKWSWKDENPITMVTWKEAVAYCEWLSRETGRTYRLPTEAEWEFAARGGRHSQGHAYAGSPDPEPVAWYKANSNHQLQAVGKKQPNELGLHDMSGNNLEFCLDWDGKYEGKPQHNPQGPEKGWTRVIRGGAWYHDSKELHVAYRYAMVPSYRDVAGGFRVVCVEVP